MEKGVQGTTSRGSLNLRNERKTCLSPYNHVSCQVVKCQHKSGTLVTFPHFSLSGFLKSSTPREDSQCAVRHVRGKQNQFFAKIKERRRQKEECQKEPSFARSCVYIDGNAGRRSTAGRLRRLSRRPSQALLGDERAHHDPGHQGHPRQQPLLEALLRPPAVCRCVVAVDFRKALLDRTERRANNQHRCW